VLVSLKENILNQRNSVTKSSKDLKFVKKSQVNVKLNNPLSVAFSPLALLKNLKDGNNLVSSIKILKISSAQIISLKDNQVINANVFLEFVENPR